MLVTNVQKLIHERNQLIKELKATKTFVGIIDVTLKLEAVKFQLRQKYMVY